MVASLIYRRLYRSLLQAARPFESEPNARVLSCLLHSTTLESWASFLREKYGDEDDEEEDPDDKPFTLFHRLLSDVIAGDSIRQMVFPEDVVLGHLRSVIRREFRNAPDALSTAYTEDVRRQVAFMALRELNKKLTWASRLQAKAPKIHPHQAARWVAPLPRRPPSAYLKPGSYLLAHPNLSGYFRRTVICILDHKEEGCTTGPPGTYGLIVNRVSVTPQGKSLTLEEILRPLPDDLMGAFGGSLVKEGGPVHMSLQMLHAAGDEQESELCLGGQPLATATEEASRYADRAVYYKGDIMNAANAVLSGRMDREDVSFFVGASSWTPGQLEGEIERGCWLPCHGPPSIAHSGICEHEPMLKSEPRPKADLWLSMMSACGEDEAALAHLVYEDDGDDELGDPCDAFFAR